VKDLVPVQRQFTVPAAHARTAVAHIIADRPLVSIDADPAAPYQPATRP
jgi:hypothetical protein